MSSATEVKESKQARRWCFTWNNPPETREAIEAFITKSKCSYYVIGHEVAPTTGTKHLQGYMEFSAGKRLSTLKEVQKEIHWLICKGSQEDNYAYCTKGGNFIEGGIKGQQGARTDLEDIRTTLRNGGSMLEVAEQNFGSFVRYHKGFEKYQYLLEQQAAQSWRTVNVSYWWGPTGTGKSRAAWTEDPNLYTLACGPTGMWWTGYTNQKTVCFDDFRGNGVQLHVLLRWLDGYPVQVPVHGGMVWLKCVRIIITSNIPLESLYPGVDEASREALKRRITDIRHFCENATEATGNTVPSQKYGEFSPF